MIHPIHLGSFILRLRGDIKDTAGAESVTWELETGKMGAQWPCPELDTAEGGGKQLWSPLGMLSSSHWGETGIQVSSDEVIHVLGPSHTTFVVMAALPSQA